MSPSAFRREEAALQTVVPGLEAEGFQVFIQPSRQFLPSFMSDFRPDAIAIRPDKKVALEVVGTTADSGDQRERLRLLHTTFADHPDWELRVIYAPENRVFEMVPVSPPEDIQKYLVQVESAYDAMGAATALLAAWAAFEAAARAVSPEIFGHPQSTSRLVEALAGEGYLTPDEADLIRQLNRMRAQIAHGRLDLVPAKEQVDSLIRITREMLDGTA